MPEGSRSAPLPEVAATAVGALGTECASHDALLYAATLPRISCRSIGSGTQSLVSSAPEKLCVRPKLPV